MVLNIISNILIIIAYYSNGLYSIISRDISKDDLSQLGKRININVPLNFILSGVMALLLWLLRDPLLSLYLIPESDKEFTHTFYNLCLSIVPIMIYSWNNGSIVLGLHALLLKMIFEISALGLEVITLLLCINFGYGIEFVVYCVHIRWVILVLQMVWIYRPTHVRRYLLFTRKMWNFQSSHFRSVFTVDSSFMIMRGILLVGLYMSNSFLVSHLGTYQLAAYTFMSNIFLYSDMIGDVIGVPCILKGSQYYGLKSHSLYRRMLKVASLVGIGVSILLAIILFFGKDMIFRLFTSDNRVHVEIDRSYSYYLIVIFMSPILGILESFMMSRQYFIELFVISLIAALMWAPIIAINMELFQNLSLIWVAQSVLFWTRIFGSSVIIACQTYQEWSWPDGYPDEKIEDTEAEELKEGEKTPLIYSM